MSVEGSKLNVGGCGAGPAPGAVLPLVGGMQTSLALPEIEDGFFDKESPDAIYTAARFRAKRPDDYYSAIKLAGQGASASEICRLLHIHHRTLAAACSTEKVALGEVIETTNRGLRQAVAIWGARAGEAMMKLDGVPLFIAGGIAAQRLAEREAAAQPRTEIPVKDSRLSWEAVLAARAKRRQAAAAVPAEFTDVPATPPAP